MKTERRNYCLHRLSVPRIRDEAFLAAAASLRSLPACRQSRCETILPTVERCYLHFAGSGMFFHFVQLLLHGKHLIA